MSSPDLKTDTPVSKTITPDLDKYLERLVEDAESDYVPTGVMGVNTMVEHMLNKIYPAISALAICAVLREQREAKRAPCDHDWETPADGVDGYMGASICTKCGIGTKRGQP